jgi:hypothetical protein
MSYVLVAIYAVTSLLFIPLFVLIMIKLKKEENYSQFYEEIKCKLTLLFSSFIVFLIFRFWIYIDMKYFHLIDENISSSTEVPFYISEILITLTISYVLYSVSKMERDRSEISNESRPLSPKA